MDDCELNSEDLMRVIASAKEELGGFCKPPFDGSLLTGIKALSMRCDANERKIAEAEKRGKLVDQALSGSFWTEEARQAVHEVEEKFNIEVTSIEHFMKVLALYENALETIKTMRRWMGDAVTNADDEIKSREQFASMILHDATNHGPAMECICSMQFARSFSNLQKGEVQ